MARLWHGLTQFTRKRTALFPVPALVAVVVIGLGLLFLAHAALAAPNTAGTNFFTPGGYVTGTSTHVSDVLPDVGNWIIVAIADVLLFFASLIGNITLTLIGLLIDVAQFNNFIDAPAVVKGWKIVRDVCNMFFIVILLLIAFGSVFHIEEYQYKKILGKLLIMAVLINFSKSIAGFFIDISQVVMLTFVNGFHEAAAGNFLNGFHISEMFTFAKKGQTGTSPKDLEVNETSYLGAAALALVTIIITTIVVAIYLVVFLLRIIALWFLIIISPIAYALSAFPGDAKKYSSMWWDYFGKYATTGPILAFFLWLSLAVMQQTDDVLDYGFVTTGESQSLISTPPAAITQIGRADILLSFIVNIMLLMGGLWMTQQLGVAGGKLAAAASNKIQGAGAAIGKGAFKAATYLPREYGKRIGYGAADMGLGIAARIPLVGSAAAVGRAKLRAKREYEEEKGTRYMQYMDKQDIMRISRRSMRGVRAPHTESGRALAKRAMRWSLKNDEALMSPQAKRLIQGNRLTGRAALNPNNPAVIQANKQYYTNILERLGHDAGWTVDADNNDVFNRDQNLGKEILDFMFKRPDRINPNAQSMQRIITDPGAPRRLRNTAASPNDPNNLTYVARRMSDKTLQALPVAAWGDDQFTDAYFDSVYEKIRNYEQMRQQTINRLMALNINNVRGLIHNDQPVDFNVSNPDVFQSVREFWRPYHRVRANAAVNVVNAAQGSLDNYNTVHVADPLVTNPNVQQGQLQGRSLADVDKAKLERTRKLINKHGVTKYSETEDFKAKPDDFYEPDAYVRAEQQLTGAKLPHNDNTDLDSISGVRGTIRKADKAQQTGAEFKEARVAVDFEKMDLSGQGYEVSGEAKQQIIDKIAKHLRENQSEVYSPEEIESFIKAASEAKQLSLINKGRTTGSARHILAHESAHAVGEDNPQLVQEVWKTLPDSERQVVTEQIKQDWNNPEMKDEDTAHEYFAEAVANESRWAGPSGLKLNDDGRNSLKQVLGQYNQQAIGQGLTPVPTVPNPNIMASALGAPTDNQLISALQSLTDKLNVVGGGLTQLARLNVNIDGMKNAVDGFTGLIGVSNEQLAQTLKSNNDSQKYYTRQIMKLLDKYKTEPATQQVQEQA